MTLTENPSALKESATFPINLAVPSFEGGKEEVTMRILRSFDPAELALAMGSHLVLF
jgi:hypothetical protein